MDRDHPHACLELNRFDGAVFDLDGVITRTADLHAAAWKAMFDDYLKQRSGPGQFRPFDRQGDYRRYVDGKPAPDMFREAARRLAIAPHRCLGIGDATAGVEAAHAAGYAHVIGVDRAGQAKDLREHGADTVVEDLDLGVPARGLHGGAYRGHIFWDELFVFPLFNLRMPEITRALLRYRHRRLGEARRAARRAGYQGAMYPWQSGSNGREESQRLHMNPKSGNWIPGNSHLQRHVNAAIAYKVWQYYQVSCDVEFLSCYGAEMILEIARFWASMANYNPSRERYEIRAVMGPDGITSGCARMSCVNSSCEAVAGDHSWAT